MIKITCGECKESFRISENNIIERDSIICQNCYTSMSQDILNEIQLYAKSKIEADKHFTLASNKSIIPPESGKLVSGSKTLWSFTIESK